MKKKIGMGDEERFQSLVHFSIEREHGGMWENQIAPHCYDCQRLQQEQAPEQWEGGMGGRKRGGRWSCGGGGVTKTLYFPRTQIKMSLQNKFVA